MIYILTFLSLKDVVMNVLSSLKASSKSKPNKKNKQSNKSWQRIALLESQKAVLMCPHEPQTWAMLIAALGKTPKVMILFISY